MAAGTTRKISGASARARARKPKARASSSKFSGVIEKILLVSLVGFPAIIYQRATPPSPKICGSADGPPVTATRIQLKGGRHLAYEEFGVPKEIAKNKIIFIHGTGCCRLDVSILTAYLSPDIVQSKGICIISLDRPGYGESDPHPGRTAKSLALDIEELADQLGLGSKFYVIGFSMGGQAVWGVLKYIPHRLLGAALVAPVVNYWWPSFPANLSQQAYELMPVADRLTVGVAHYAPWLAYWWNSQRLFPASSVIQGDPNIYSDSDRELLPRLIPLVQGHRTVPSQQGEHESLFRDLTVGFGSWEFDPMEIEDPFPNGEGSVHLWHGEKDVIVPASLQRYIASKLPWIQYHELGGDGHLLLLGDGRSDSVIRALLP